jgi:hypothetical protein
MKPAISWKVSRHPSTTSAPLATRNSSYLVELAAKVFDSCIIPPMAIRMGVNSYGSRSLTSTVACPAASGVTVTAALTIVSVL